jgi:tetratricopeptide (TPR) repeat protein
MCAAAQAQSYEQLETWCHDDNATDDQTIQGCSAVITSGRESGEKLSRVYYDRGLALLNKNRLGPAIEDFDEAIRLNPNFAKPSTAAATPTASAATPTTPWPTTTKPSS